MGQNILLAVMCCVFVLYVGCVFTCRSKKDKSAKAAEDASGADAQAVGAEEIPEYGMYICLPACVCTCM